MGPKTIAKVLLPVAAVVLLCAAVYFVLEGIYSVGKGGRPSTSLAYDAYSRIVGDSWRQGLNDPSDPNFIALSDAGEIERLLEKLKADGVGLGNTPYHELGTEKSSTRTVVDGCRRHKPNLRKVQAHLVTRLFNPLDPVMAFWDADRVLDPDVTAFLERYSFSKKAVMSTNQFGDRVTLPAVTSDRKVIVAGDSVAYGLLLNDDETVASRLQALDPDRQYINTGISGAKAYEVVCAIETAERNYGGKIDEIIYIYYENDFRPGTPYGEPEEVVDWLEEFAAQHDVGKVTVVYSSNVYNILPQLTRFRGDSGYEWPHHNEEKRRLIEGTRKAGFRFINFTDIALKENRENGTMFAALALFVDHVHYSPLGAQKLAQRLRGPSRTP